MSNSDRSKRPLNGEIDASPPNLGRDWQSRFTWHVSVEGATTTVFGDIPGKGTIENWQIVKNESGTTVAHTDLRPGVQAVAHESPQGSLSGRVERVPSHRPTYEIDFVDEAGVTTAFSYSQKDDRRKPMGISAERQSQDSELLFETLQAGLDAFARQTRSSAPNISSKKPGVAKPRF